MFKQMISDVEFTFVQVNDGNYAISGEIEGIRYEAVSSLEPVGSKGIEEVKKMIDYVHSDCLIETVNNHIAIHIPIPFTYKTMTIELEHIDEAALMQKKLDEVLADNKALLSQVEEYKHMVTDIINAHRNSIAELHISIHTLRLSIAAIKDNIRSEISDIVNHEKEKAIAEINNLRTKISQMTAELNDVY